MPPPVAERAYRRFSFNAARGKSAEVQPEALTLAPIDVDYDDVLSTLLVWFG
jgi:hypothetical protein